MDPKYVIPKENRGLPSSLPSPSSVRRNVDEIAGAGTHVLDFDKENVCCGWQQHGNEWDDRGICGCSVTQSLMHVF